MLLKKNNLGGQLHIDYIKKKGNKSQVSMLKIPSLRTGYFRQIKMSAGREQKKILN